jgi:histidinol-phosphate aminotransferase
VNFKPYIPGEQPQGDDWIKLNTNENPYPPPPAVTEVLHNYPAESLRKYPDAVSTKVRQTAGKVYNCDPDKIIVGNGSDEILAMILRSTMNPGDKVTVFNPSYTLYKTLAYANGGIPKEISLEPDFSIPEINPDDLGQIVFIPNPNSPTGTLFKQEQLKWLCENAPGVVVIDEAYAEFAGVSYIDWIDRYENCIITRTLSKSYALCGIRLGFGFAGKNLLKSLYAVKDSYNVNAITQAVGVAALEETDYLDRILSEVIRERCILSKNLEKRNFKVYPSSANFILVDCPAPGAEKIYENLKLRKILVRYFKIERLDNSLRITVGLPVENEALLSALDEILS